MKRLLSAFGVGILMALGLGLAGMTLPEKIVGFLDFTGKWDPSLVFVLLAAVTVYAIVFRLVMRRPKPVFDQAFSVPTRRDITGSLVVGSLIFGAGWGIAGLCPAPALLSLTAGNVGALVFVVAMFGGMLAFKAFDAYRQKAAAAAVAPPSPTLPEVRTNGGAA